MPASLRLFSPVIITGVLVVCFAMSVAGQQTPPGTPSMSTYHADSQKEALYAQFSDFKRNLNPEQQRFAYPTAKEYLRLFGGERDAETNEVRRFVIEYERAMHERELYTAFDARNYAKTFDLGRPLLKSDPENFFVLGILSEAGYDNALSGNASLNTETVDYLRKATRLLDDGKVAKADPFKSVEVARGFLNFALGWFVKDEKPVEAAAAFLKAVQSDSPYRTDPSAYHRMGIAIIKGEFTPMSDQYNEKYGAKQGSALQQAMLNLIMHTAYRAIDAYARAVALSTKPEQQEARAKILAQLTALYKNFHDNSDEGLNDLIATVLSKPLPLP